MSGYVLRHFKDNTKQSLCFVARPGSEHSYTRSLQNARVFASEAEAERDRCVESERVMTVEEAMRCG